MNEYVKNKNKTNENFDFSPDSEHTFSSSNLYFKNYTCCENYQRKDKIDERAQGTKKEMNDHNKNMNKI